MPELFGGNAWAFTIGSLIIVIYGGFHFSPPADRRSSTTSLRYYTFCGFYIFTMYVIYCLLALSPDLLDSLSLFFTDKALLSKEIIDKLSPPYLAVFLITIALTKIPKLKKIDEVTRKIFYRSAAIPARARQLSANLQQSQYQPPKKDISKHITRKFNSQHIDEKNIAFKGNEDSPAYVWSKITAVIVTLQRNKRKHFEKFFEICETEFDNLRDRYDKLSPKALRCVGIEQKLRGQRSKDIKNIITNLKDEFMNEAEELCENLFDYLSRAILYSGKTEAARYKLIAELGFKFERPPKSRISPDHYLLIMLIIIVSMIPVLIATDIIAKGSHEFQNRLLMAIRIGVFHTIGIISALYPKIQWEKFRWKGTGIRPIRYYFLVGLLTLLIGIPIYFILSALVLGSIGDAFKEIRITYPFMLLPVTTAVMAAILTDNPVPNDSASYKKLIWKERFSQAVISALIALAVYGWLLGIPDANPPLVYGPMAGSFLIGFLLGWIVPAAYRESLREEERNKNLIEGLQRQQEQKRAARKSRENEFANIFGTRIEIKDSKEQEITTELDLTVSGTFE